MVESSFDPDSHFCLHLLDAAVGTLVAADILVEDSVHALGLVMPLNHMRNFYGSLVLDYNVWTGYDLA